MHNNYIEEKQSLFSFMAHGYAAERSKTISPKNVFILSNTNKFSKMDITGLRPFHTYFLKSENLHLISLKMSRNLMDFLRGESVQIFTDIFLCCWIHRKPCPLCSTKDIANST